MAFEGCRVSKGAAMIDFNLDMEHRILTICPKGALSEDDS